MLSTENMSVPNPTRGLISSLRPSSTTPSTPAPASTPPSSPQDEDTEPPFPGTITTNATHLSNLSLSRPILRFSFPTAAAQTSFHHAFSQLRTPHDRAAFMERFFENYEGVVEIPRRIHMDTSNDVEVARRLASEEEDRLRSDVEEMARGDEEVARRLQGEMSVQMGVEGDEELARRLAEEERMRARHATPSHHSSTPGGYQDAPAQLAHERRMRLQQGRGYAPPPRVYTNRNDSYLNHTITLLARWRAMAADPTRYRRLSPRSSMAGQPSVQQQFGNGYGQPAGGRGGRFPAGGGYYPRDRYGGESEGESEWDGEYDGEFGDGYGRGGHGYGPGYGSGYGGRRGGGY